METDVETNVETDVETNVETDVETEYRKLTIAIDLDDTTINSRELYLRGYHHLFPERKLPLVKDMLSWDLQNHMEITEKEKKQLFDYVRRFEYFWGSPTDKTFDFWLKKLQEQGHTIYILTFNPEWIKLIIQKWLAKYDLYDIDIKFVTNMNQKKEHKFDVLMDDSRKVAQSMKDDPRFVLFTDWSNISIAKTFPRIARNFKEFYEHVQDISTGSIKHLNPHYPHTALSI